MPKHVALVKNVLHSNQFIGLPAGLGGAEPQQPMPAADFLLLEGGEGSYMLLRYTSTGDCSGDTWHASFDDAVHQANYEFGLCEGDWTVVPEGEDPILFGRTKVTQA